jgi:hypothetical protein
MVAVIGVGCGGGNMQTSSSNNGNPPAPSASNPGGGNSGSGGSGGAAYYFEALLSTADSSNHGQISLNASGAGTIQLQGVSASTSYSIQFCQFPNGTSNCFAVGSSVTDTGGNAQTSFTFSRSGTWAGIFLLQPSGGGTGFDSSFPVPSSGIQYQNPVQQAGAITGGIPSFLGPPGSDPLSSGLVTINGTVAHVTLNGAAANATYAVGFCGNGGGSTCFADIGTVSTDASGNGAADVETRGYNPPGVFHFGRNNAVQFITGIRVP